jgi:hypothetical protein
MSTTPKAQITSGNQILTIVNEVGAILVTWGPLAFSLALKIKSLLSPLGPDIKVNIQALADDATTADQETVDEVNAFLKANNLPLL